MSQGWPFPNPAVALAATDAGGVSESDASGAVCLVPGTLLNRMSVCGDLDQRSPEGPAGAVS